MPFDLKALDGTAWLMEPGALRRYAAKVAAIPTCPTARQLAKVRRSRIDEAKSAATSATVRAAKGKIGLIRIHGPVQQRMTSELDKAGGTSLEEVGFAFDALMAAPEVGAIVLHFDSPGGSCYGTEEMGDKVYAARGVKKVYAISDSLMCSAAFWIGTAAEVVCCTPGGDVGSVGVYACHVDESKALADEGLTVTMVQAGQFKTEFSSHQPLTDDARSQLQGEVNNTYAKFIKAVARNRGVAPAVVKGDYGQGRPMNADQALAAGAIDKVITFDELLAKLTGTAQPAGGGRGASAAILRMRHEHAKRMTEVITT
jgi:signal peptide peptidase SppA